MSKKTSTEWASGKSNWQQLTGPAHSLSARYYSKGLTSTLDSILTTKIMVCNYYYPLLNSKTESQTCEIIWSMLQRWKNLGCKNLEQTMTRSMNFIIEYPLSLSLPPCSREKERESVCGRAREELLTKANLDRAESHTPYHWLWNTGTKTWFHTF